MIIGATSIKCLVTDEISPATTRQFLALPGNCTPQISGMDGKSSPVNAKQSKLSVLQPEYHGNKMYSIGHSRKRRG